MAHLARLGISAELVQEQADRLKKAREFVARAKKQIDENEVLETEEREVEEEVSVEEVEVEGGDEEWLDRRESERARVERESSGTGRDLGGDCNGNSAVCDDVKNLQFFAACAGVSGSQKVLTAQLVPESTGSPKTTWS